MKNDNDETAKIGHICNFNSSCGSCRTVDIEIEDSDAVMNPRIEV